MDINLSLISDNASILVVDDTKENLALLSQMLKNAGYSVRPVPNGRLALQALEKEAPDLIILDITMPEINGYQVCEKMKQDPRLNEIPVIFISALVDTTEKLRAFEVGGVDYITKPFKFDEVRARVDTHLRLHRLQMNLHEQVNKQIKAISEAQMSLIFGLAKLAEARDYETGKHLERIQILCQLICSNLHDHPKFKKEIDQDYCNLIFNASPLHDIGKVGIPDRILLKPGKLTTEEFEIMKTHAEIGAEMLQSVFQQFPNNRFLKMGIEIAKFHHENWDGTGYPEGRSGNNIPLCARVMAIVDVYDAVRSKRVYKPAVQHEETCHIIRQGSETQFDPDLVNVFITLEKEFKEIWSDFKDEQFRKTT